MATSGQDRIERRPLSAQHYISSSAVPPRTVVAVIQVQPTLCLFCGSGREADLRRADELASLATFRRKIRLSRIEAI